MLDSENLPHIIYPILFDEIIREYDNPSVKQVEKQKVEKQKVVKQEPVKSTLEPEETISIPEISEEFNIKIANFAAKQRSKKYGEDAGAIYYDIVKTASEDKQNLDNYINLFGNHLCKLFLYSCGDYDHHPFEIID